MKTLTPKTPLAWLASIDVPEDSLPGQPVKEKRTAASLYPAFQALLDRTEYLRNNVNADNINSGTLPAARLPAATASVFGAVKTGSNITNTAGTISIASANVIAALGYTPANRAGDTFTGKVTTAASAAGGAGFNLPHGVAPTTPGNGDIWSTSAGIFARINGATQQMLQSVGLSLPSIFTVTGSPVNAGAGTLTAALATQAANQVFAGPASGGAVAPSFRSLVVADLPTVDIAHGGTGATSKAAAFDALSPMLAIGDLIYGGVAGANTRLAGNTTTTRKFLREVGDGANASAPAWDTLTAADIPSLDTSKLTAGTLPVGRGGTGQASYAVGDLLYASSASALSRLAAVAGPVVLVSNGAAPSWSSIDLTYLPGAWAKKGTRVATTANITLSGTQTIDGVAVVVGDRVLVKDQISASQNGIYVVAVGAWARSADADASAEIASAVVAVDEGSQNAGRLFTNSFKPTDTLGTTSMPWYKVLDTSDASSSAGAALAAGGAAGSSTAYARADHVHPYPTAAQVGATPSGHVGSGGAEHAAATQAVAGFLSAADKTKLDGISASATNTPLSSTAPAALGASAVAGVGTTAARADHVHPQPANATTGAAGLMSSGDKTKLDGIATSATNTPLSSTVPAALASSAAVGTGTTAARADHAHPYPTPAQIGAAPAAGSATQDFAVKALTAESVPIEAAHLVGAAGEPAFQSGWSNYSTDGTWVPARFFKDKSGIVTIEGLVNPGAYEQSIFTLPVGYRPSGTQIFIGLCNSGLVRINIGSNGTVIPSSLYGASGFVSLSGVRFRAYS